MSSELSAPRVQVEAAAARTTIGSVRPDNEDRWGQRDQEWFVVADGMGGHAGGEIAAAAVVEGLLALKGTSPEWIEAISGVNNGVRAALTEAGLGVGGSTMVALCLSEVPTVVHVGDSRAYVLRAGEELAEQLTEDHNVEMELLAAGQSVQWYRSQFGRTDALTRYLGGDGTAIPTVNRPKLLDHDRLLLCSDGIHGYIGPEELSGALRGSSCAEAAARLIAASLAAGGHDNATAIVVDIALETRQ